MIRYELYDQYGKKIHNEYQQASDCGSVILEYDGRYYRPIHYDLNSDPQIAKCVPVKLIKCRGALQNEKISQESNCSR